MSLLRFQALTPITPGSPSRLWSHLDAILGHLGAVLELFGIILGHLEAILVSLLGCVIAWVRQHLGSRPHLRLRCETSYLHDVERRGQILCEDPEFGTSWGAAELGDPRPEGR